MSSPINYRNHETEAVKTGKAVNTHMNEHVEIYGSSPSKVSNQVEEVGLRHELGPASDKTNNANKGEIGSGKINLKDN